MKGICLHISCSALQSEQLAVLCSTGHFKCTGLFKLVNYIVTIYILINLARGIQLSQQICPVTKPQ